MSRQVIVVGDTLSPYGGTVLSGSGADTIDGKAVARRNDLVDCRKHGKNAIAEGEPSCLAGGEPVALEGHHASCGCVLVSVHRTLSVS